MPSKALRAQHAKIKLTLSIIEGGNETVGKAGARRGVAAGGRDLLFPELVSLSPR